jgi:hypothetical protein
VASEVANKMITASIVGGIIGGLILIFLVFLVRINRSFKAIATLGLNDNEIEKLFLKS